MNFTAFFLPTPDGQRLCIHHAPPSEAVRGAVIYLHPFAEEMHKSRRMAALQARALAASGFHVLQIDLLGCGDSSGDFGDATWEAWKEDAQLAIAFLRQYTNAPLWLWGLRVGALLASDLSHQLTEPVRLLLWNPVISGKQFLQQFLRLKVAGEIMAGDNKGLMDELRRGIAADQNIEVAGYLMSAAMAKALESVEINPTATICAIRWLETSTRPESTLSPAAQVGSDKLRMFCTDIRALSINGPSFWQTTEIEDAPALISATVAELVAAS